MSSIFCILKLISTDPGLLKIRHSHRFFAVVRQILMPFIIKCPSNKNKLLLHRRKNRLDIKIYFLFNILGTKVDNLSDVIEFTSIVVVKVPNYPGVTLFQDDRQYEFDRK